MKKTYILTIEYDEEKLIPNMDLCTLLGISQERASELRLHALKSIAKSMLANEPGFDSFSSLTDLLDLGELNGNEILFYLYLGYIRELK